ncbi:O-antigen ligase family protein [Streptomyces sp. ISL-96]|uniref:O-antigen ligase family protein n=1 Tax=Streptomyces sp. ISL-96 TaxID=2819191 RepID=UPI001BE7F084|nr:O-antigen ligase family protein [Streptomyces sp. ISL-96]MBT2487428.1 O-antigen ligase family protein [Streptomyces sp. ISL-96]
MTAVWTTPVPHLRGDRLPLLPLIATVLLLAAPIQTAGADTSANITPADLASCALVLSALAQALHRRRRPLTPTAALVLGLPAVAIAVATATATDPTAALTGFVRYLQVFVLVPAAVVLLLRTPDHFRIITTALIALAVTQGATGVYQYATSTGASYMGEDIRAVGTFGATDVMGMATVVSYGLLAALALALRPPKNAHPYLRPCAITATVALTVPLALSFSRGAWIATLIAAFAMILLTGRRQAVRALTTVTATAVILVGGFGIGSEMISQRLTSITEVTEAPDRSVTDRYTMWTAAASMWQDRPATGVGLKGFPAHRDAHASIALSSGSDTAGAGQSFHKQALLSPHNMYLLVLAEQGLIGLTAFLASWAAILLAALRRLRSPTTSADCGLAAVGLATWQTVDFLYADIGGPSTVLTGIILGLAAWWALAPSEERA